MNFTQLIHARWFPTVTKPLLAGLMTMGVLYGLRLIGVTGFTSWEVNNWMTPIAGILVAAIVTKPNPAAPKQSAAEQMKQLALQVAHEELANNPDLVKQLASKAFQAVMTVEQASPPMTEAQEATEQGFVS